MRYVLGRLTEIRAYRSGLEGSGGAFRSRSNSMPTAAAVMRHRGSRADVLNAECPTFAELQDGATLIDRRAGPFGASTEETADNSKSARVMFNVDETVT